MNNDKEKIFKVLNEIKSGVYCDRYNFIGYDKNRYPYISTGLSVLSLTNSTYYRTVPNSFTPVYQVSFGIETENPVLKGKGIKSEIRTIYEIPFLQREDFKKSIALVKEIRNNFAERGFIILGMIDIKDTENKKKVFANIPFLFNYIHLFLTVTFNKEKVKKIFFDYYSYEEKKRNLPEEYRISSLIGHTDFQRFYHKIDSFYEAGMSALKEKINSLSLADYEEQAKINYVLGKLILSANLDVINGKDTVFLAFKTSSNGGKEKRLTEKLTFKEMTGLPIPDYLKNKENLSSNTLGTVKILQNIIRENPSLFKNKDFVLTDKETFKTIQNILNSTITLPDEEKLIEKIKNNEYKSRSTYQLYYNSKIRERKEKNRNFSPEKF